MISLKDIESLTAFKRNSSEYIRKIKKSGNPLVLTIKGKAEIVVQDVESYQRILEVIDRADTILAVREGLESVRERRGMRLEQFDKEMRKRIHPPKQ